MSPELRNLLGRRHSIQLQIEAINHAANGRELLGAESGQLIALDNQVQSLNVQIERARAAVERERTAPAIDTYPGNPNSGEHPTYLDDAPTPGGRRYAEMFPHAARRNGGGFRGIGEFLAVVRSGMPDPRLIQAAAGGNEGVGADGGWLVEPEYIAEVLDQSLLGEIVRPRAAIKPMTSSTAMVSGFNTLDHTLGYGGFAIQWAAEGETLTPQKAKVRAMQLKASKMAIFTGATSELFADSGYYSRELPQLIIDAAGFGLDERFLRGSGVGQPRGVLNDPALIVVAKEGSQPADTITWENLKAMDARLHPRMRNAVWVASHTTKVQLRSLVQMIETTAGSKTGQYIPITQEQNGRFTILGREVIFTELLPVLGDQGDILLVDFSQYYVGLRQDMTIRFSEHLYFQSDEIAVRCIFRGDGQGRWSGPMLPRTGTANNSLSWCVTLAERA